MSYQQCDCTIENGEPYPECPLCGGHSILDVAPFGDDEHDFKLSEMSDDGLDAGQLIDKYAYIDKFENCSLAV